MSTKTRFEKEAKGNSEMAYFMADNRMRVLPRNRIRTYFCLVKSFPIGPERKHKVDFLLYLYDQAFF